MTEENTDLSQLPKGWVWTRIGEVGSVAAGGTPSTNEPSYFNGEVPWITPADLSGFKGKFISKGRRNLSEKGLNSSSAVLLPAGTVLFSSRAPIGYVAIATNSIATNQGFKNITCYKGIFNEYVFYYLKGNKQLAESFGSGTTFREVSASRFTKIPFPLAPFPEQRRIVGRVEELFSRLDAGVESLRKVRAQLKIYRQAVLKYAFEGKLTEEWRQAHKDKMEPAQKLLERIKEERKKNAKGKYKELPPIDTSDLPLLPEGWIWTQLGEVISVYSGKGLSRGEIKKHSKYPVYGGNGICGYSDKFMFEEAKLIVGRVGAKCGVVHTTLPKCWVTDNALIVDFWQMDIGFLFHALQELNLNQYSGSTAQAVISQTKIYPVPFRMPPLIEQYQLVKEIETRLSRIDEAEKVISQGLSGATRLRQSILKMAFDGRLVPQDPTDEPAKKLLERIKEEKAKKGTDLKQMELVHYVE